MKRRILDSTKRREKRGEGTGADYRPWIKAREINSAGVTHNIVDWKTGRTVELLSEGEAMAYYILRWNDSAADIREQFPLDLDATNAIADQAGISRVDHGRDRMTTDLLVTWTDGTYTAYSVKADRSQTEKPRDIERLWVEKMYWTARKVPWKLIYKEDLDRAYADNIRLCVEFYDKNKVFDEISRLKHRIAVKEIRVDMRHGILDFPTLAAENREELPWKR